MTIKEAILKSLEDIGELTNYMEVTNHISFLPHTGTIICGIVVLILHLKLCKITK